MIKDVPESQSSSLSGASERTMPLVRRFPIWRVRIGLATTLTGFLIFLLGTRPGLFGLDRSPVIGFVQIAVFLIGLAFISIGGYISLAALWMGEPKSILADIGLRLVSTGYVVCVFTGMADVFGFGSQTLPFIYFGPLQARGVEIGEAIIALGFLMLIPYTNPQHHHSHVS
jgi:hypothetical protein